MKLLSTLALLLSLMCLSAPASAQKIEERCGETMAAIGYALAGVNPKNYTFSLKVKNQTFWILFLSKPDPATNKTPWRLLQRQGEGAEYCIVGAGDEIELLKSIHQGNATNRYGMPGSGYPRCYTDNAPNAPPTSLFVRAWANQELGESTVIYLQSNLGKKNYFLLASNDGFWILLDSDRRENQTCYTARGDASDIRQDFWPK